MEKIKEMKKEYNWWKDPANAEQVKRLSWWEYPENKATVEIPVSIIEENGHWTIATNKETEELIGKDLASITASEDSKEEAIKSFFILLKSTHYFEEAERRRLQRWVPFRKGSWKRRGGRWFVIFGIHFYFRYGNGMKGGKYIPFTKLNVSVHSEWAQYNRWKKQRGE